MSVSDFFKLHKKAIVFDTEFTTWDGALERGWSGIDEYREIFQICALRVDLVNDEIEDSFERFVYPRKNPQLSKYAEDLTGITQEQVNNGVDFKEMYTDFLVWSNGLSLCSYARGSGKEGEGEVIKENIDLYGLDVPYDTRRFINLAGLFAEAGVNIQNFSSGELYKCFDLELPGDVHNANHDANSLAISLLALKEELEY